MKPRFRPVLGVLFSVATAAFAQSPGAVPSAPTAPSLPAALPLPVAPSAPGATDPVWFTAEQLDQLLGPVALYPDALLALLLPASTNSTEIVLAARFLANGRNPAEADTQPWDDSVRALVRYPATLRWMGENLAWTRQLGETFRALHFFNDVGHAAGGEADEFQVARQRLRHNQAETFNGRDMHQRGGLIQFPDEFLRAFVAVMKQIRTVLEPV